MSDLSKHCLHLLEKEGLGPVRGGKRNQPVMVYKREIMVGCSKNIINILDQLP